MTRIAALFAWAAVALVIGLGAFWILILPTVVPASALPVYTPNLDNGRTMFNIGGCSSCHAVPNRVRHVLCAEYFARPERRHR